MLSAEQISFLYNILKTNSPSGCEDELISLLRERLSSYCEFDADTIGNLYMWVNKGKQSPTIMVTAHADEVGFQVTHIDKEGFVYFRAVATPDCQTIPGSEVIALTKNGKLYGVIGKKSPHVLEKKECDIPLNIQDMWIDFGFESEEEATQHIECGDYITLYSEPQITCNGKRIISKALDNKISIFILAEVIKELSKKKLFFNIVGVATAQEELGCRGSIVAANRIKPDIAFILDVGVATDIPNMTKQKYGAFELGKGVGIIRNADNNEALAHILINVAHENKIPYQKTVGLYPTGGTESAAIQLAKGGVTTANISIPNRYMHSLIEMCDMRDVEDAINLLIKVIETQKNVLKGNSFF
ncbi:MAG: M42 family metallopeptidase [Parabacteroides distasonis]